MGKDGNFEYNSFTSALWTVDKDVIPSPEKEFLNILQKKEKYSN